MLNVDGTSRRWEDLHRSTSTDMHSRSTRHIRSSSTRHIGGSSRYCVQSSVQRIVNQLLTWHYCYGAERRLRSRPRVPKHEGRRRGRSGSWRAHRTARAPARAVVRIERLLPTGKRELHREQQCSTAAAAAPSDPESGEFDRVRFGGGSAASAKLKSTAR
jgi:hypothetical protein